MADVATSHPSVRSEGESGLISSPFWLVLLSWPRDQERPLRGGCGPRAPPPAAGSTPLCAAGQAPLPAGTLRVQLSVVFEQTSLLRVSLVSVVSSHLLAVTGVLVFHVRECFHHRRPRPPQPLAGASAGWAPSLTLSRSSQSLHRALPWTGGFCALSQCLSGSVLPFRVSTSGGGNNVGLF